MAKETDKKHIELTGKRHYIGKDKLYIWGETIETGSDSRHKRKKIEKFLKKPIDILAGGGTLKA